MTRSRLVDAIGLALAGGVLSGLMGRRAGAPVVATVVGVANGALAGWHRIHRLRRPRSIAAFVLDSTWALPTTTAGLISHAIAWSQDGHGARSASMSTGRDRHVYARGMVLRRGYALTWGNVISGAGDVDGHDDRSARRRALVDRHEDLHVWQSRWLGPVFPVVYVGWMVGGVVVGTTRWLRRREHPLAREVEAAAYVANPLEWWAYSRDANWPPRSTLIDRVWRQPFPGIDMRPTAVTMRDSASC